MGATADGPGGPYRIVTNPVKGESLFVKLRRKRQEEKQVKRK